MRGNQPALLYSKPRATRRNARGARYALRAAPLRLLRERAAAIRP
jgi:hypothetical protein